MRLLCAVWLAAAAAAAAVAVAALPGAAGAGAALAKGESDPLGAQSARTATYILQCSGAFSEAEAEAAMGGAGLLHKRRCADLGVPPKAAKWLREAARWAGPTEEEARHAVELGEELGEEAALLETAAAAGTPFKTASRWPTNTIRFSFVEVVPLNQGSARAMVTFMRAAVLLSKETNLNVLPVPFPTDEHSVYILHQGDACQCSPVGYDPNTRNTIIVSEKCAVESAVHEILHAAGFTHTQKRHDRDAYVTVLKENVKPSYRGFHTNYVVAGDEYKDEGPYDYGSVMHYSSKSNSRRDPVTDKLLPVIVASDKWRKLHLPPPAGDPSNIGSHPASVLTEADVRMINEMYPMRAFEHVPNPQLRPAHPVRDCIEVQPGLVPCGLLNRCPTWFSIKAEVVSGLGGTAVTGTVDGLLQGNGGLYLATTCRHVRVEYRVAGSEDPADAGVIEAGEKPAASDTPAASRPFERHTMPRLNANYQLDIHTAEESRAVARLTTHLKSNPDLRAAVVFVMPAGSDLAKDFTRYDAVMVRAMLSSHSSEATIGSLPAAVRADVLATNPAGTTIHEMTKGAYRVEGTKEDGNGHIDVYVWKNGL